MKSNQINLLIMGSASSGIIELPQYVKHIKNKLNCNIKIVVSKNVQNFIDINFLSQLTGSEIYTELFNKDSNIVHHDFLKRWADYIIILPCTANTLSKISNGIADNLLTMIALTYTKKTYIFPNMNIDMWNNKIIQINAKRLVYAGHRVIEPNGNGVITGNKEISELGHMPSSYDVAEFLYKEVIKND